MIRPSAAGAPKLVKASAGRWSKSKERVFLSELAGSGSIRLACKAIGLSKQAVSKRRLKDRYLGAACDAAIEVGRAHLNGLLVEISNRTFDPDLPIGEDGGELPKVTVAEAIQIAKMGPGRAAAPEVERCDIGAVRERLEKAMRAVGLLDEQEPSNGDMCCGECGRLLRGDGAATDGIDTR